MTSLVVVGGGESLWGAQAWQALPQSPSSYELWSLDRRSQIALGLRSSSCSRCGWPRQRYCPVSLHGVERELPCELRWLSVQGYEALRSLGMHGGLGDDEILVGLSHSQLDRCSRCDSLWLHVQCGGSCGGPHCFQCQFSMQRSELVHSLSSAEGCESRLAQNRLCPSIC